MAASELELFGEVRGRFEEPAMARGWVHEEEAGAQSAEGGVVARYARYCENQRRLVAGMEGLGFECVLSSEYHSPIITGFRDPQHADYAFQAFYDRLKAQGFVIYPGKVTGIDSFRIGTIGHVFPEDIDRLIVAVESSMYWV